MHHPHEPIMYSRNKFHRTEKIPHQCYFKAGDAEIRKIFEMVDTISNMQLVDLNSKPHGGKSLRNIIYCSIGSHLYPPTRSMHYQLLCLDHFHGPTHINCRKKKKGNLKKYIYIQCTQSYYENPHISDLKIPLILSIFYLY